MTRLLLKNGKLALENEMISEGYVYIEGEKIKSFGPISEMPSFDKNIETIELSPEDIISPGFIDIHIHGAGGADTMDGTTEALSTMATTLPAEGTTSFLATTITQEKDAIEQALKNAAHYYDHHNNVGKAEVLGIHLEGPFLNVKRAGAQPKNQIIPPDIDLFKKWQTESKNLIKLVTLAPEEENALELIRYLRQNDIVASIGHSDASYLEVQEAVNAGATHVTHLYNGMREMHHREPGVVGAALLFEELIVEIIADGIHVRPEMIKLALQSKGTDGMVLVTDSMRAKCLKNGQYDLGGHDVTVKDGMALLDDGTLAGSILKMKDSVQNIMNFTHISLLEAIRLAAVNPAKQLNIFDRKGSINVGKDADIIILNEQLEVVITICRGVQAYKR